jgi:hypothetical protein
MTVLRTKRLSNPRRVAVARNTSTRKRKLSPKQIAIFGTKRQKAALKAKRARSRNPGNRAIAGYGSTTMNRRKNATGGRVIAGYGSTTMNRRKNAPSDGGSRVITGYGSTVMNKRRRNSNGDKRVVIVNPKRSPNPALLVTLGPVLNPHRSKAMPKTAKRKPSMKRRTVATNRRRVAKNAHRPRTKTKIVYRAKPNKRRMRKNPTRVVVVQRRNTRRRSRSNPDFFGGSLTSKQSLMILAGGFAGLIGAKFIPTLLPATLTGSIGTSTAGQFAISLAAAVAVGWAAGRFVSPAFGNGAMFGGLIQATSVGLNAFLPSVYSSLGIGLGDLLPGSFAVPQNPIRAGMQPRRIAAPAAPAQGGQARVTMSGLARAYGSAF